MEDTWLTCHRHFVKELDEWDKQGGWDVLFYGDSIVEEWRCVACSSGMLGLYYAMLRFTEDATQAATCFRSTAPCLLSSVNLLTS